jgi:hypothetical protein
MSTLQITDRNLRHEPQYALRREGDCWQLIFEGWHATFKDHPGASYVACLLLHPPRKPIHALALALGARSMSGQTPAAAEVIQQRYLGLDEAEAVRHLRRREHELEAVLHDDEQIEPVKAEALRELEAIANFMRRHPWRSRDCIEKCARVMSLSIRNLHARLAGALDINGKTHLVLHAFARHLNERLLIPSDGGGIPGRFRVGAALPGWFTYEPPPAVVWEVLRPASGVQSPRSKVQNPEPSVRGSGFKVRGSTFEVHGSEAPRPAAVERLASFLSIGLALALLATGCACTRPLKGGKAVTTHKPAGVIEQTLVQGENASQATRQDQESVRVRTYTILAGSQVEQSAVPGSADSQQPSTINSQPSTTFLLSSPMPVVEREETHARTELGAAQKDTARELGAKLASLKGIVWVGVGLFVFGLASLVWPPLKVIIGSVTTSAALTIGGLALMVLPSLIVGNELLILGGVALTVGGWFLAHRHGQLRGLVAASSAASNPSSVTSNQ